MKIPEKAPQFKDLSEANLKRLTEVSIKAQEHDVFKKANNPYLYWDTFKYLNLPDSIPADLAWVWLRTFVRGANMKKIPLKNKEGGSFTFWLPGDLQKTLHFIDKNAGGHMLVDDPNINTAEKDRYLISSIMEEAIASSQLEGAATTREKAKAMLRSGRKPINNAEQMIVNNYTTIVNIKQFVDEPLSKQLIINIQASITKDTLDREDAVGRFKKIGEENQVVDDTDGTILFDPPPAKEIEERIAALCDYANNESEDFVHPVVKAIILHFWLAYIHPFVDGNGRTARAIFYWCVLKNGYWLFEYLSISRILLRAVSQYAKAYLYSEIDSSDLTYFLIYNLRAINLSIKSLNDYLVKRQQELSKLNKFIKHYPGLNYRQYELLQHAVSHPNAIYTIKYQKNVHKVAYQTARTDLFILKQKGFLKEIKLQGKEAGFTLSENIGKKIKGSI